MVVVVVEGIRQEERARTPLSRCRVARSRLFHFVFFHVSRYKKHGTTRGNGRGGGSGRAGRQDDVSALDYFLRGWPRQDTAPDEGSRAPPAKGYSTVRSRRSRGEDDVGGESMRTKGREREADREVLRRTRRSVLKGRTLFVGGTDVWVGVGHAWKDVPRTKTGGRGRSALTYAFAQSISLRSPATTYPWATASYAFLSLSRLSFSLSSLATPKQGRRKKKYDAHNTHAPLLYSRNSGRPGLTLCSIGGREHPGGGLGNQENTSVAKRRFSVLLRRRETFERGKLEPRCVQAKLTRIRGVDTTMIRR